MSPAQPRHQVPDARSWEYADGFVAPSPAMQEAREAARADHWEVLGNGTTALLTFLARVIRANNVVSVGTDAGVSALAMLEGMTDRGVLTSVDPDAERQAAARRVLSLARVRSNRVRLITGTPLDVLPKLRDDAYDMVLINGDRLEYVEYLSQALRLLRQGGIVIVNAALANNHVADPDNEDDDTLIIRETLDSVLETEEFTPVLLPVGEGLLLAAKA
ncbi:O-methyltransferase [Cutibacterium sp.]|uniref:O-methyltransferase n=1 Tax=Cutibacterium sp. TaxID=1912221 RepID=UPI0026DCD746|nr:class I SAM-dependent methyltransferase [Cutibacterium sp.]MDO4411544.1 class I SAM-dependent methyltransferase [Cutibacterium sp.]